MFNIEVTFTDYPDDVSLAVIFYMNGCEHNCTDCHNKELQKEKTYPVNIIDKIIDYCNRNKTNKIVLSGGDPLYKTNIDLTNKIIDMCKNNYDICIYTGYNIDYAKKVLHLGFKFIKSGKYIPELKQKSIKNDDYIQLASSNQEFYNKNYMLISNKGRYYFNKGEEYV